MPTVTDREAALDAYIDSLDATLNFNANPSASVGDITVGPVVQRMVAAWDLSDIDPTHSIAAASLKVTPSVAAGIAFACHVIDFDYLVYVFLEDTCTWNEANPGVVDWPNGGPVAGKTGSIAFNAPTGTTRVTIATGATPNDVLCEMIREAISTSMVLALIIKGDAENINDKFELWRHSHGVAAASPLLSFEHGTTPVVTTTAISSITTTAASSGGNVTSDGGGTVSARGICWNTTGTPTTGDNTTSNGTGTGAFASSLTGLSPATTYYVRAYATNQFGTAYGSEVSFTSAAGGPASRRMLLGVGQ